MSENIEKSAWPLWRWLLCGTMFVLFCPSLFMLGAILVVNGIVWFFKGFFEITLLGVLG